MKREPFEPPVATSAIPREIPPQPWYVRKLPLILVGGLVPFGVVFVELYFFLSSIWMGYGYYLFGFVSIVILILIVTTSEISVVLTYSLLCAENYHWWWMSFIAPASSGVYAFVFSLYYLVVAFNISNVLVLVEAVGYLLILSTIFSLFTGCVGFLASFVFVSALFGSVKVDYSCLFEQIGNKVTAILKSQQECLDHLLLEDIQFSTFLDSVIGQLLLKMEDLISNHHLDLVSCQMGH